jgi:hypothetical protein
MTGRVTIDALPGDVLLEVFDCYVDEALLSDKIDAWHTLVHVSRKWRCVVFDSPRRLNLQLLCSARAPVREMLGIWPPFPIIIQEHNHSACNEDNIVAALEHHDRVCDIRLWGVPGSLLVKLLAAMQKPFPALAYLELETKDNTAPVISDFLGGFAPDLGTLFLTGMPILFPGLRKLLLSATNLVTLSLSKIPHSGYFSPEAMVTCLSALTRLIVLDFEFESPRPRPYRENRRPPPPARTLLPALRDLQFTGVSEYLEDLVARIDTPLLYHLDMTFFHQLIFDITQLAQFISRGSRRQRDEAFNTARVIFSDSRVTVSLPEPSYGLVLGVSCRQSDWQLSALAQVCSSSFPHAFIPTVEHLYILEDESSRPRWQDDIENSQWLELLHPFTALKNLFLSKKFALRIAPALQELVGERANEVLPALQSISLEGFHPSEVVPKGIGQFIAVRQLSSRPIAVIPWTKY